MAICRNSLFAIAVLTAVALFSVTLVATTFAIIIISYILGIIEASKVVYIFVSVLLTLLAGVGWILQKVAAELILEWLGIG